MLIHNSFFMAIKVPIAWNAIRGRTIGSSDRVFVYPVDERWMRCDKSSDSPYFAELAFRPDLRIVEASYKHRTLYPTSSIVLECKKKLNKNDTIETSHLETAYRKKLHRIPFVLPEYPRFGKILRSK